MSTNPVHPGSALDQALNIAYAAARGQVKPEINPDWVETVAHADAELRALRQDSQNLAGVHQRVGAMRQALAEGRSPV